jgi:hypothetical protein
LIAVGAAFVLFATLAFVTVTLSPRPPKPAVPVQQTGATAVPPHRVSAAADIGRVINGRFVSNASSGKTGRKPGPVSARNASSYARVPGAVPAAAKPKPLRLPIRGKGDAETSTVLAAATPAKVTGYNQKTSRQLAPGRPDQVVYSNADGTKTAFQYKSPVNFRQPDGKWASISTSLVPAGPAAPATSRASAAAAPDAWFETPVAASPSASGSPSPAPTPSLVPSTSRAGAPASTSAPAASPTPSGAPQGTDSPSWAGAWSEKSEAYPESFAASSGASSLVTVPVDGSHSVSFGISGAAAVTGAASGSTVRYADVRPDSSVSFSAGTGLVKENIVLSSPSAPATWVFPLELKGLRAQMGTGGIVEFTDSAGKILAYVPHGFMSDSNIDPHSGNGATSYGVTYSLATVGGRQAIKMTMDTAWLASGARVYPVTVDPSVMDEYASSSYYTFNGNVNTGNELEVGTYDSGADKAKSYLKFSNVGSDLTNDTVLGVRLNRFNTWSYSCSARSVGVYPVTSSSGSTGGEVGSKSFASGWVPLGSTSSPCPSR